MGDTPKMPVGLDEAGQALWSSLVPTYEFRPDELRLLSDACREADLISLMEAEMAGAPLTVKGSQGQPVANPMLSELRQHRAQLAALLKALKLPDDGQGAADRSAKARDAANARWKRGA